MRSEQVAQGRIGLGRLGLEPRDLVLLLGDQRAQPLELGRRRPRPWRRRPPCWRRCARRAPAPTAAIRARRVSSSARTCGEAGGKAAARQGGVEGVGRLADQADVVHGKPRIDHGGLSRKPAGDKRSFATCRDCPGPGRVDRVRVPALDARRTSRGRGDGHGVQDRDRGAAQRRQVDAVQRPDPHRRGAGGELSVLHHRAERRRGERAGRAAGDAGADRQVGEDRADAG